ncbi:class I SAM-dependent rRNA methyltransferase [Motiliproteus sp. MSK22-1]|uniref:class I SAM-dependent rRNA methyltransferase n=1 Tax=Motiliproteus sp. MSK22-1 TaxID=1897630 RepID=UPI000975E940|nr:class I SAM-dependent rRNA methyltransferase [Motiliproteus sp. MSK22-1]OMH38994.1 SAM-dependent methyltransferase [Motiliproteus sp. MSK22-1]
MLLQTLRLKPKADKRLRAGHVWIYSNEIDIQQTPLKQFSKGEQVVVEQAGGKSLGVAYLNPNNLICGRLVSRDSAVLLDKSLLVHRLKIALSLRQRCFSEPYYRLVFGDSDGLPGLVVDRFDAILVVQISTAGMELLKSEIIAALEQVLKPDAILIKNDGKMRSAEDLESYVEVALGDVPALVPLIENGTCLLAPVLSGQKTGWFYDHRMNRARLQHYAQGKRVLDVFSYVGGWGLQAANAGAAEVTCVDASQQALDVVSEAATINDLQERVHCLQGDAFDTLRDLKADQQRFDVVVIDPPAFIQKRKDIRNGEKAYERINQLAMRLLEKDGILVSASCSMHLQRDRLVDIIRAGSRKLDRQAQIIEQGHQGPDHPVHPAIPETDYLKSMFVRVLPA